MTKAIKFALVCPSWLYNLERVDWARRSLASLARTQYVDPRPYLIFVVKPGVVALGDIFPKNGFPQFTVRMFAEPSDSQGGCAALTYAMTRLFHEFADVTHALFVGDDFVYHTSWLLAQRELIKRHPNATSWYVYRSNNARWHKTLREENGDMLVTSISGPGVFSREEWAAWNLDYHCFPRQDGWTMDLLHSIQRPGERWVTAVSYIQQIGVRGQHNNAGECDEALDFVGEGATLQVGA